MRKGPVNKGDLIFYLFSFIKVGKKFQKEQIQYNSNKSGIVPVFDFTLQIIG